ncbi:MAG: hypothetical protein JXB47_13745 [Anaerolineae bacterium]|nr:hypothetical protein [Anaerolineae bacterium]
MKGTHPIIRRDAFSAPPRGRIGRRWHSPFAPFAFMMVLVLAGFGILALSEYAIYAAVYSSYPSYALQFDCLKFAVRGLYGGLVFAVFVGGWGTGLAGAFAGAPLVAGEFKRQTWDALATTPYTNKQIIYAKFAAALWRLRHWLGVQCIARAVLLLAGFLLWVAEVSASPYFAERIYDAFGRHSLLVAVMFGGAFGAFVILQPLLTAGAGASLGVLWSTLTTRPTLARGMAVATRLALWAGAWISVYIFYYKVIMPVYFDTDYEVMSISSYVMFCFPAHFYEFGTLIDVLFEVSVGWVIVLLGIALIVVLALIPIWLCLRAAAAMLSRQRA